MPLRPRSGVVAMAAAMTTCTSISEDGPTEGARQGHRKDGPNRLAAANRSCGERWLSLIGLESTASSHPPTSTTDLDWAAFAEIQPAGPDPLCQGPNRCD